MWPDRFQVDILTKQNQFSEVLSRIMSIGRIDKKYMQMSIHCLSVNVEVGSDLCMRV